MSAAISSSFVCNACGVMVSGEERSGHYRSEWHRYNVKRHVVGLGPVQLSLFEQQLAQLQRQRQATERAKEKQSCAVCQKQFQSLSAYQAHLSTKKHVKRLSEKSLTKTISKPTSIHTLHGDEHQHDNGEDGVEDNEEDDDDATVMEHDADNAATASSSSSSSASNTLSSNSSHIPQPSFLSHSSSTSSSESSEPSSASSSSSSSSSSKPVTVEGDESEAEEGQEQEEDGIELGCCLFCSKEFDSVQNCVDHMQKHHGLFIPFREYCTDLEGLLCYLGVKIGVGHVCLWCHDSFHSVMACRQHMNDKSHCKIALQDEEDEEELQPFYDFSKHSKHNNNHTDAANANDESKASKDESDSSSSESTSNGQARSLSHMNEFNELVLTDGSIVGHRALNRYYKQRVKPFDEQRQQLILAVRQAYEQRYLLTNGNGDSTALSVTGGSSAVVKVSGMAGRGTVPVKTKLQSKADRLHLLVGMKNNNQKHYRAQVMV